MTYRAFINCCHTIFNSMRRLVFLLLGLIFVVPLSSQTSTKYDISGHRYAYNARGERQESLDLFIFYNEDVEAYYAKYNAILCEFYTGMGSLHLDERNATVLREDMSKLSFYSDSSFSVSKWRQFIVKDIQNKRWQFQLYLSYDSYSCYLRYVPLKNKLVGRVSCNRVFEAMGDSNYKTVQDAIKNGYGRVYQDCEWNCGGIDVVYRI